MLAFLFPERSVFVCCLYLFKNCLLWLLLSSPLVANLFCMGFLCERFHRVRLNAHGDIR